MTMPITIVRVATMTDGRVAIPWQDCAGWCFPALMNHITVVIVVTYEAMQSLCPTGYPGGERAFSDEFEPVLLRIEQIAQAKCPKTWDLDLKIWITIDDVLEQTAIAV